MITSHDNCLEETDHHFEVGRLKQATTRPLVGPHCKLQGAHQPRGYQFGLGDHGLLLYYQFFLSLMANKKIFNLLLVGISVNL